MNTTMESADIRHLLSRAGFGFSPQNVLLVSSKSKKEVLDHIFDEAKTLQLFTEIPPPEEPAKTMNKTDITPEEVKKMNQEKQKQMRLEIDAMNIQWLKCMQDSVFGLREKMTLFWHGHFACRVNNSYFMQQYYNDLNTHALGNFGELLFAVSKSPAMLQYLNNQQNRKAHPNENFAREVMELFTLGRGQYTEQDIKEAARTFTGWGANPKGEFEFHEKQHDDGVKIFLGKTGHFKGEDALNIILQQPKTAKFITEKILHFLVNQTPDPKVVKELSQSFRKSNYNIGGLLHDIFSSSWFYKSENRGVLIKSPVELLSNICRVNHLSVQNPNVLIQFEKLLGQVLFNPPNVAGWKGGTTWIDSSSLMMRLRLPEIFFYDKELMAQAKVSGADLDSDFSAAQRTQERINENYLKQASQRVNATFNWDPYMRLFDNVPQEKLFDQIVALHINTNKLGVHKDLIESKINPANRDLYIKGVTTYIMCTPEYQLA
jgi:uncharacterized protein (DUF1800 family)